MAEQMSHQIDFSGICEAKHFFCPEQDHFKTRTVVVACESENFRIALHRIIEINQTDLSLIGFIPCDSILVECEYPADEAGQEKEDSGMLFESVSELFSHPEIKIKNLKNKYTLSLHYEKATSRSGVENTFLPSGFLDGLVFLFKRAIRPKPFSDT